MFVLFRYLVMLVLSLDMESSVRASTTVVHHLVMFHRGVTTVALTLPFSVMSLFAVDSVARLMQIARALSGCSRRDTQVCRRLMVALV